MRLKNYLKENYGNPKAGDKIIYNGKKLVITNVGSGLGFDKYITVRFDKEKYERDIKMIDFFKPENKIKILKESGKTGLGVDGLSKQKLKTLLYKETKKCTYNKLYKDSGWNGPQCIWDVFNDLDLNWHIVKSEYKKVRGDTGVMPSYKEWIFKILWDGPKGKQLEIGGTVTASGAGTVEDPLSKYDVNMVIW